MPPRSRPAKTEIPTPLAPLPRQTARLIGHDQALGIAARAIRGGRPPQAWLICGPPGIGKATLAWRIARYLLAFGATAEGAEYLAVPAQHSAALQVAAGTHPGVLLLERTENVKTGKLATVVRVDEIRRLSAFFGMTAAGGNWRIAIVDTADAMNASAANAILKLLEEPPSRAMLLLLSAMPGRLLPTIRSRCQRLDLRPLDNDTVADAIASLLPDIDRNARERLARSAGGSIGAALQLAQGEGVQLAADAERLIDDAAAPDLLWLMGLAERIGRITDGLSDFGALLGAALALRIRAYAGHGDIVTLHRWTAALAEVKALFARAIGLNLEPRQTLLSAARLLAAPARYGRLA